MLASLCRVTAASLSTNQAILSVLFHTLDHRLTLSHDSQLEKMSTRYTTDSVISDYHTLESFVTLLNINEWNTGFNSCVETMNFGRVMR